jgi:hypothetical protein
MGLSVSNKPLSDESEIVEIKGATSPDQEETGIVVKKT